MEGEEEMMESNLSVVEHLQCTEQKAAGGTSNEANGWLIIPSLEKPENSIQGNPEDQQHKTLRENGQDSSVVAESELPEGATSDVSHDETGDSKEDMKPRDASVLPVNSLEVDNIPNTGTVVAEEVQWPGEATPDPAHPVGDQMLKTSTEAEREKRNGESEGHESFVQEILGCLDELMDLSDADTDRQDESASPFDPLGVDAIKNPDAPDTPVVKDTQLRGEGTAEPSNPGEGHTLTKTPTKAKEECNGDEEEQHDALVLAIDPLEVVNTQPDALDIPFAQKVQLPVEAVSNQSPNGKEHDLTEATADVNGKRKEENEDKMKPLDSLKSKSENIDSIHNLDSSGDCQPEESDAPREGYESFFQEIWGCLDELKDLSDTDTDQVRSGDDGREMSESLDGTATASGESGTSLCCTDYFEPALFETIVNESGNESVSILDEQDYESCLEGGAQAQVLNKSFLTHEMDNYELHPSDFENSFLRGTEVPPVDGNDHNYAQNSVSTLPTEYRCGTTSFPKGFHFTNIKLPIPNNLRQHRWVVANSLVFKVGTSGFGYIGGIANEQMQGVGRLMLGETGQFFEGVWNMNRLVELYTCNLICDPGNQTVLIIKMQNDHLLTMYEHHYIARVSFDALEELDFTVGIQHLKRHFFRKLTILEMIADDLQQKKQVSFHKFATLLAKTIDVDSNPVIRANIFILLSTYLEMPDSDLSDILRERKIPVEVREAAADLLDCESCYLNNTYIFSNRATMLRLDLRRVLQKINNDGIAQHRQMLIDKCPSGLPDLLSSIRSLPEQKIVYVTGEDMRVFDHLVSQPCFEPYKAFFINLVDRFRLAVLNIRDRTAPSTVIPLMSPVYGFLVKSFWEIISEIIEVVGCYEYKDMLKCEAGKWKLQENIRWPGNETNSSTAQKFLKMFKSSENMNWTLHRALGVQYNILFQMMICFSPENYIVNKKFDYDFRVLEQDLSLWEKGLKMVVSKKVGLSKRLRKLSTERIVWLCLLDHTIYDVFKDDPKYQILLKPYNSLLQGQISFIEKSPAESHETFRVMTHSILKFITSTAPYFREARDKPGIDVEILVQQMWTFSIASQEIEENPTTFSNFRDLIAEYNRYLNLRLSIDIEATSGHFSEQISRMMQTFMHIVATSLKKSVPTTTLVGYLRSLNDYLDDFKNIDFLAMWFVKSEFFDPKVLEKVDNKLSSGGNCSYRVIDIEKFVQVVQILGNEQPIPRHHIIQVVSRLLECVETCLNKRWQSMGDVELEVTQLECTALLLDATRKSFMYLKEQPDYVDFETFEKESIEPFVRPVDECETFDDLKNRSSKVSESFWYIRKIDEIGIDRALNMFKSANTCQVSNKLLDCYNLFLENYYEYLAKYRSLVSEGKSHAEGMNEVVKILDEPNPVHYSVWTEEFKMKEIPVMLAGLSAVWSILVSKDVSSTGKFLKPHCIQILCVLRLLSVDLQNGADNHLAQVLTGQGKSVILGLLSSVLALTGHKVRVLCYSNYLSSRDQNDFDEFFRAFKLGDKIEYSTFEEMADSFVNPMINGSETSLRQLVEDRVMNHATWPSGTRLPPVSKNTILLIDEVDVFFTDKFYGNVHRAATTVRFQWLAKIQEFIWSLATTNQRDSAVNIGRLTIKYINDKVAARDPDMVESKAFLNKRGTFPLLERGKDGYFSVKTYSNRSLFYKHLSRMIIDALKVRLLEVDFSLGSVYPSDYALTADGIISCKDSNGIYSTACVVGYRNIFNYFRLKESQYDTKHFRNYGYLNLTVGEISYARLPLQFQLILGVSGTLTNLDEYEKSGIKFYGIHNFSVLPSFFGESNLKFSQATDFHYYNKEQDWLKEICDRANSIVDSNRAVLIFFHSDYTLKMFSKEYLTKFDRLNEITENTCGSVRDAYIDEAGLSRTVTLATRGMGRGVDYKSSLSVEKNGGVHVIQTFFSVNVKEEVQIKGRTARKDNKGSYELIVCRKHLVEDNIIPADDHSVHTYGSLERIRKELSEEKGKTASEKVQKSEQNHNITMEYFGFI